MYLSQSLHRRKFIRNATLALAGSNQIVSAFAASDKALPSIALQLYTVRNQLKEDAAGTLKKLAALGIKKVETAFWPPEITLDKAAGLVKNAGFSVCSCHIELPTDEAGKKNFLAIAAAYQCNKMIWHGWPEDKRYSSLEGTKQLAKIYNETNHFAKDNGLQFGLHNHWWEFRNKVDGKFVYEILLEELDPDIFFELDTYWLKVAGHDPAAIVKRYGSRATFLHIKDGPAKWDDKLPEDIPEPMTAVGKGTQNFTAIAKAGSGNTKYMVIEMDVVATDVFVAIKESVDYLQKKRLAIL